MVNLTGLQYLNARYYDPKLGQFTSADCWDVRQAGVGTNRYAYSGNDPINAMDPGGNSTTHFTEAGGAYITGDETFVGDNVVRSINDNDLQRGQSAHDVALAGLDLHKVGIVTTSAEFNFAMDGVETGSVNPSHLSDSVEYLILSA